MIRHARLAPLLLLLPCTAVAQSPDDHCEHRAERSATVPASGPLRLAAGAGSLRIEGRPGLREVRVRGVACASSRRDLERIQLIAERDGDGVRVEARIPGTGGWASGYARLDLTLEVPQGMEVDATDSSGGTEIRNVGSLRLQDSSGEIEVESVAGDVRIEDSSGEIRLQEVRGAVWLQDSSGDLEVRGVRGSVEVEQDGSGDIRIHDVARDVRIGRDSSGSIDVSQVRGGLAVDRDGSGGIRYRDIAGTVSVPTRRR